MKIHPLHLIIGLLLLVVVADVAFMIVARRNMDTIVPSYELEAR